MSVLSQPTAVEIVGEILIAISRIQTQRILMLIRRFGPFFPIRFPVALLTCRHACCNDGGQQNEENGKLKWEMRISFYPAGDPRFLLVFAVDVVVRMSEFSRRGREGKGSGR